MKNLVRIKLAKTIHWTSLLTIKVTEKITYDFQVAEKD